MDADKKKPIMIGIIVVCLILAGGITYFRLGGESSDAIPSRRDDVGQMRQPEL